MVKNECCYHSNSNNQHCYQQVGHLLSFPPSLLHLEVAKKVSEVDVEELPTLSDHDVVRVTVADSQHIRGHAVACTRHTEGLLRLKEPATK